ncbi:hypothetical protein QLQ85_09170 [Halomonas sp. M4R5S39]|uniref:hypothetical protein n=1 Tax=Halomonas kalidii TaxID=3043293 RepID=UPI0024A7FEF4|nr:hypothetical protein [Halomonas kalidii]MDI5984962.1 hypothetical protein [Halomonas kalidii]
MAVGVDKHRLEAGSWKLEAGSWKLEAGSWKLEAGSSMLQGFVAPVKYRSAEIANAGTGRRLARAKANLICHG